MLPDLTPWLLILALIVATGMVAGVYLVYRSKVRRRSPLDMRNAGLKPSRDAGLSSSPRYSGNSDIIPDTRQGGKPIGVVRAELQALERHLQLAVLDPMARERLVSHAMREVGSDRALAIRKVLTDLNDDNEKYR